MRKMCSLGFELTILSFWRQTLYPLRHGRFTILKSIFPIHRQLINRINFNTDKTVSRQSELYACLPTL